MDQFERLRNFSRGSRGIFWIIIVFFIAIAAYAFFSSRIGQIALLFCCAAPVLLIIIGLISEGGMGRPR